MQDKRTLRQEFQIEAGLAGDEETVAAASRFLSESAANLRDTLEAHIESLRQWKRDIEDLENGVDSWDLSLNERYDYDYEYEYESKRREKELRELQSNPPKELLLKNDHLQKCSKEQIEEMPGYQALRQACSAHDVDVDIRISETLGQTAPPHHIIIDPTRGYRPLEQEQVKKQRLRIVSDRPGLD